MIHRVLVGGTASGKKTVAAELHGRHDLSLLSMDSMKVYRGMDIGTDKPSLQLRSRAPFALLDLVGHQESFSAGRWVDAAREEAGAATSPVMFVGGTPLYLRLLLRGIFPGPAADPALRAELDALWERKGEEAVRAELAIMDPVSERRLLPGDRKRVLRALEVARLTGMPMSQWQAEHTVPPLPGRFLVAALRWSEDEQRRRCADRVDRMFNRGLLDEVVALRAKAPFALEPGRAIGYAECLAVLDGTLDMAAAAARMVVRSRQLLRRQRIFLAQFPEIRWVDTRPDETPETRVDRVARALELD